jgi:putative transposase
MRLTFKYRAYANQETIANAENWLELMRQLYNAALEERIWAWKMQHHRISLYDQDSELHPIRKSFPEYKAIDAQALGATLHNLDSSFQGFFRRVKSGQTPGFPRFKGCGQFSSFTLRQHSWKIDGNYLSIRNVGRFKLRLSRPIQGEIKTVTVRRDAVGHWYACFSCDNVPLKTLPKSDKAIGLDVGISSFLTDSDGRKVENPKCLRQAQSILRRKQRTMARRKKGSNRRNKARIQVAKAHQRVQHSRMDFLHKTANFYIANYGTIVVEDLNIAGMVRNHHLALSISDASWGIFFGLLQYKAECAGRTVRQSKRFNPTSKTCHVCGCVNRKLKLSDRKWTCPQCETEHDRDGNASKNILADGLEQSLQAVTCGSSQSVACESVKADCH